MSSVAFLVGLLVIAFAGSQVLGAKRAFRLASGAEYLLLGFAIGPHALRVVSRSTLEGFSPVALVGAAWVTLVIGGDYGYQAERRVSARGFVAGTMLSLVTFAAIAAVLHLAARHLRLLTGPDLWIVPGGVALVSCETTRHAVRWVLGRHAADGPLARLVADAADCDDLVPILGLAALFAMPGPHGAIADFPVWALAASPLVLGAALGFTSAALLRSELKASDGWGVLIGATLVTTGIASRLGLSTLAGTFALGLTAAAVSRHRRELRSMLRRTEQPVILPLMLLAGALVSIAHPLLLAGSLGLAFVVRLVVRLLVAPILTALAGAPRSAAPALAFGLLPAGALSVVVGMAFEDRIGGTAGDVVLGVAVGLTVLGELIGPRSLRRALQVSGETNVERGLDAATPAGPVASPEPSK